MNKPNSSLPGRFSLDGKVAIVTGAGRGLGLEIARALAEAGVTVYINGRDAGKLEQARNRLDDLGIQVIPLVFDVENTEAVNQQVNAVIEQHGAVDILINNVGVRDRRGTLDMDRQSMQKLIDNHVLAAFDLTKLVAPGMMAKGDGRIINMVSVSAFVSTPGDVAYSTAKGGMAALTRALAADLGPKGITVNAIAPGAFATETNNAVAASEQGQEMIARRTSLGRWGKPEEVAGAAVFLASSAASYVTGHVLAVDGGLLAHY